MLNVPGSFGSRGNTTEQHDLITLRPRKDRPLTTEQHDPIHPGQLAYLADVELRRLLFTVEESDDNTTYTAVAAADLQGTEPVVDGATDDDQLYELGYLCSKRYLRVAVTISGATTGAVYSASIITGHPAVAPVSR